MTDREALLQCYRSGQMSAAQFERHCKDDPELRKMTEAPKVDRPICTADEPAAPPKHDRRWSYGPEWNTKYRHPDATRRCIDEDYDDWLFSCPHCQRVYVFEGADA